MNHQSFIISPETGWILLAVLSALWIFLGVYWGKKVKNMDGFMLAGRNVGLAFGAATAMATWVTSNTTMLAPQFALQLGIWGMIAYSTASFGLFLFAPLANRIKALMPTGYTSGDFIRLRYGKFTWYVFLVISIFYGFTWLVSMGMAGGILMNAIAGIPYELGMTVILGVCVVYTLFGGLYAVIGTDFIQSLIILIGIVVVGVGVLTQVDFGHIYINVLDEKPMLLNALMPAAIMSVFNNLLFGLGEVFHSNVWWSRAFAMREKIGKKAYLLSGLFWFPVPIAAGFIALTSGSLGVNITSPDMVGPLVASHVLGQAGAVIVFAVFFCSLASSIDSLLAATSDLITEDIYRKMINPKAGEKLLRKVSAGIIIGLGVLAWAFCMPRIGTLATVLFFAGPMVGSTIWPIVTGLFWRKASAKGAMLGMILGSSIGLVAYFQLGWYTASLIGAAVSMVTVLVCTYLFPDDFEWNALNESKSQE
ncbi:sodium:solute symporter family protein [Reichenbachiella agariperforans]|uniref:sodium:solute symporter family protein n=1 Tax=Reichenbachiella agariperforans TaxID=156994 RepID=UPI001C0A1630|nr:sodium:solute symporter family protein [Reichenbachiella agariperforans]MBU2913098.1 sodium:solute symporter family protein [Reichenbachiella agariperforans]